MVFLIVVFAGGAFLSSGGFVDLIDLVIGMSMGEMKGMYAGVSPGDQKALDADIENMRKDLRDGKISVQGIQPFLTLYRDVTSDGKVTPEEVKHLRAAAHKR